MGFALGRNTSKILKYTTYATGIPTLVTMLTVVVEYLPDEYGGIRPNFGVNSCFFETKMGNLLYFHILLMALEVANAVFFILVALKLHGDWKLSKQAGIKHSTIRNGTSGRPFKGIYIPSRMLTYFL